MLDLSIIIESGTASEREGREDDGESTGIREFQSWRL
jgi:hypothetical protein